MRARFSRSGAVAPVRGRTWLVTFGDLMCLLLSFFVLLYAMRAPDTRKYASMRAALTGMPLPRGAQAGQGGRRFDLGPEPARAQTQPDYLAALFQGLLAEEPALEIVDVIRRDDRVVLSLPVTALFSGDATTVTPDGRKVLVLLGDALDRLSNQIEVLIPVRASTDPTADRARAWPLAVTRGIAVAASLRQTGLSHDLTVKAGLAADVAPAARSGHPETVGSVDFIIRAFGAANRTGVAG